MVQVLSKVRGNLKERIYSIIRGAENDDIAEVKRALDEDPQCINDQDERLGVMALHIAAADGNLALVKFLLDQPGCRPAKADHSGRDACYMAEAIGRDDIAELITDAVYQRMRSRFGAELDEALKHDSGDEPDEEASPTGSSSIVSFPSRRPSGP